MPVAVEHKLDVYPQLCVMGLQDMIPDLASYSLDDGLMGKSTTIDAGYYTVTPDGRPLIGPQGEGAPSNAFLCGGMGTYGLMGAPAAGELAALHVLGGDLPQYAGACTWPRTTSLDHKPIDLLDDAAFSASRIQPIAIS